MSLRLQIIFMMFMSSLAGWLHIFPFFYTMSFTLIEKKPYAEKGSKKFNGRKS